jgi:excisionase family DNA binding protein
MTPKRPKAGRTPNQAIVAHPTNTLAQRASRAARSLDAARRAALSTGAVARYCFVSAGTVVNWIAAGQLDAQRTAGGQFRIRVAELRAFMRQHGMRTDAIDADFELDEPCWTFWSHDHASAAGQPDHRPCAECPVRRSGATVCRELRPLLPGGTWRAESCEVCPYRRRDRMRARGEP